MSYVQVRSKRSGHFTGRRLGRSAGVTESAPCRNPPSSSSAAARRGSRRRRRLRGGNRRRRAGAGRRARAERGRGDTIGSISTPSAASPGWRISLSRVAIRRICRATMSWPTSMNMRATSGCGSSPARRFGRSDLAERAPGGWTVDTGGGEAWHGRVVGDRDGAVSTAGPAAMAGPRALRGTSHALGHLLERGAVRRPARARRRRRQQRRGDCHRSERQRRGARGIERSHAAADRAARSVRAAGSAHEHAVERAAAGDRRIDSGGRPPGSRSAT